MEGDRFDLIARSVAMARTRRAVLRGMISGVAALAFVQRGKGAANGPCADFCRNLYPPGPDRGACISAAAQGDGICPSCKASTSNVCYDQANQPYCPSISTDPANCGYCGNVCVSGQCLNGSCAPVQISNPVAISGPGIPWVDELGASGVSALTYGHNGCGEVDAAGFCVTGVWTRIPGAHWIFKTQNVTDQEANDGTPIITFTKTFSLPGSLVNSSGTLLVTADNAFRAWLNGTFVGEAGQLRAEPWIQGAEGTIWSYPVALQSGVNTLAVEMVNYAPKRDYWGAYGVPPDATPWESPSGLIFRLDLDL